ECYCFYRVLRSFPTRRSSDLRQSAGQLRSAENTGGLHALPFGPSSRSRYSVPEQAVGPHYGRSQRLVRFHLYLQTLFQSRSLQRSEEHTSELQSRENIVCRLL